MRLFPRLLVAISVPLLIVVIAVATVFVSTSRVTSALTDLRVHELSSLQSEAGLHRAGWDLDVAMRHGTDRCLRDAGASAAVVAGIAEVAAQLEGTLLRSEGAHPSLLSVSRDYVTLADSLQRRPTCEHVVSAAFQRKRWALDERLTNVWVERMAGLHDTVIEREERIRELTTATFFGGLALVGIAIAIALAVSYALARSVTAPLAVLTRTARRLGGGDLEAPVPKVGGVTELVEFQGELESMRGRLAELDALKQGFIASCSHELRTPLSKMREALALLADGAAGSLGERQLKVVQIARGACERQIRTVTSILDLSRLRAGTPLQVRHASSVDGVVDDAIEQERVEAEARGVLITTEAEGERGMRADLDDALVEHALANLIRNAVSVSHAKQVVHVSRRIHRDAQPDDGRAWLEVDVVDQGPGVPPDIERSIFLPFVTHAPSTSPKRVGVGLGLALAREVAEAHGGRIELVRREAGSCFRFSIPLERGIPAREDTDVAGAAGVESMVVG